MPEFKIHSPYQMAGDQPEAVAKLGEGINNGLTEQTLMGVTGSGKTFTMANIIEQTQRPTLVLAHNKTLAAQLCTELREFFPENAVEYFVSYYDYYQPEAYIASTDTYIEKDSAINDEIDRLRHSATSALSERRDVIIVSSVSCIYSLGDPIDYKSMVISIRPGMEMSRDELIRRLIAIQYERNDIAFERNRFRVRGDTIDVFPAEHAESAVRVELFDDEVDAILLFDPITGAVEQKVPRFVVYPASHYVTPREEIVRALGTIGEELKERRQELLNEGLIVEAQRLEQRTRFDMEMMDQVGFCKGIENYSRHLTGLPAGAPPPCLIDYLPEDTLMFFDESHVMMGQIGGMYRGDRARKETLVRYGFRLPSALDNRPLRFDEFESKMKRSIFVSATPADYELEKSGGEIVEQVVRPTGLVDPAVEIRPAVSQVDDLLSEIHEVVKKGERVLVTTLTKRMAEDLTDFLSEHGVRVRYLHSDIDTVERVEIIRDLRAGVFDVLVGINLLREGLDIPEVSLVAILDADKEGFLRSERSLIQTIGRAARNLHGRAILYADRMTDSMRKAVGETERRREKQEAFNREHGIVPRGVKKEIRDIIDVVERGPDMPVPPSEETAKPAVPTDEKGLARALKKLEDEMMTAARNLDFERAAKLREELRALREEAFGASVDR